MPESSSEQQTRTGAGAGLVSGGVVNMADVRPVHTATVRGTHPWLKRSPGNQGNERSRVDNILGSFR